MSCICMLPAIGQGTGQDSQTSLDCFVQIVKSDYTYRIAVVSKTSPHGHCILLNSMPSAPKSQGCSQACQVA